MHMLLIFTNFCRPLQPVHKAVEVVDGTTHKCNYEGDVKIDIISNEGWWIRHTLRSILYVLGLNKHFLSVNQFTATDKQQVNFSTSSITLTFDNDKQHHTIMLPCQQNPGYASATNEVQQQSPWQTNGKQADKSDDKSRQHLPTDLLHQWLGHHSLWAILATDEVKVWANTDVYIEPDAFCMSCCIAMSHKMNCSMTQFSPASALCAYLYLDIIPNPSKRDMMWWSFSPYYLLVVMGNHGIQWWYQCEG